MDGRRETYVALLVGVLVLTVETMLVFGYELPALLGNVGLIFLLLGLIARGERPMSTLYQSVLPIPVAVFCGLAAPFVSTTGFAFVATLYLSLLVSAIALFAGEGWPFEEVGLRSVRQNRLGTVMLIGGGFGTFVMGVLTKVPTVVPSPWANLTLVLGGAAATGLVEAVVFQALIQRRTQVVFGSVAAIVSSILFYVVIKLLWFTGPFALLAVATAVVVGWLYERTSDLYVAIAIHGFVNVLVFATISAHNGPLLG